MSELDELLSRLPAATEAPQTFEGKAVGRDKDHLHLAISSGVIAIPLAEIAKVTFLDGQPNDIVSVQVRHSDRVKQIRHVSRMLRNIGVGGGFGGGGVFEGGSDTYSMGRYVDSATASGGRADATDDTFWVEVSDDVWT